MNRKYIKPVVSHFTREDVTELLGPAQTQYPCTTCSDAEVSPNEILQGKVVDPLRLSVDTGDCPEFERIEVTVPGSSPFVFYEFNRADGTESGGRWSVDIEDFQFLGARGEYDVVIQLIDDDGDEGIPCQTTLQID